MGTNDEVVKELYDAGVLEAEQDERNACAGKYVPGGQWANVTGDDRCTCADVKTAAAGGAKNTGGATTPCSRPHLLARPYLAPRRVPAPLLRRLGSLAQASLLGVFS